MELERTIKLTIRRHDKTDTMTVKPGTGAGPWRLRGAGSAQCGWL
jgi:hypothetical protein